MELLFRRNMLMTALDIWALGLEAALYRLIKLRKLVNYTRLQFFSFADSASSMAHSDTGL